MIYLDKEKGVPLYIQLKNQIVDAILKGEMKPGMQMQTERELAKELGVSRKTVATAYNLLEKQGVIVSHQGRGTFITDEGGNWMQSGNKESVLNLADLMINEAMRKNMQANELIDLVVTRIHERADRLSNVTICFVECNLDQANDFSKSLGELLDLKVIPLTINDLELMNDDTRVSLLDSRLVVPAFNHVQEVKDILFRNNLKIDVQGVATIPNLKTMIKLAKFPDDSKFAFFALSEEMIFKINLSMKKWGLDLKNVTESTSKDERIVWKLVQESDAVIVSPARYNEIKAIALDGQVIIPFEYLLEEGSVNAIKTKLSEN